MNRLLIFTLFIIILSPLNLRAADPKDDIHAIPPILDPAYRHKKNHQFELSLYGGSYLGDTVGQTWMTGAKSYFHLNNTWSFGAAYGYSKLEPDRSSTFGGNIKDTKMQLLNTEISISNDAAFRVGKSLVEMDFYLTFGAGAMQIDKKWEPAGVVGGGVKFYPGISWLAFRIDVNNYIHYTSFINGHNLDFDTAFLGGISFLFPARPSPFERKK